MSPRAIGRRDGDEVIVGIVGGSGLYELEGLQDARWAKVKTPFGEPSDAYRVGRLGAATVVFLSRHGRGHRLSPSEINYQANIYGLKALGARWVISVSAVGSMKEDVHPLDLVVPVIGKARAAKLCAAIWGLEKVRDVRELRTLLRD